MNPDHEANILFWGSTLSPILYKPLEDDRSDRKILLSLTSQTFIDPSGMPRSFSLSTFKRKLKAYRESGIQGLVPALRSDEGKIRKDRDAVLERAIELKKECPSRSHSSINLILRSEGLEPMPTSTLLRHLNQNGATIKKLGYDRKIIRKRWSRDHTHSLWVGDFSQGPYVIDETGKSCKTWISAFIDTHSRFLVVGLYALTSDIDALVNSLLVAFAKHGKPQAIYLDNAKVYRGNVLSRACLDLGIELIHRAVRDPQGGGIIERFFLTAQKQFESEFSSKSKTPLTLDRLNELFGMWVDGVYHKTSHSETKQIPEVRYQSGLRTSVTPIRREIAQESFYQQWDRRVHLDFCDVTLNKYLYACDPKLRGDRVLLRCPLGGIPDSLEVWDLKGRKKLGNAHLHDRSERVLPDAPPLPEDKTDYAKVLERIRERQRQDVAQQPLPQVNAPRKKWSLPEFISKVCMVSGLNSTELCDQDLLVMAQIYAQQENMNMKKLRETWNNCEPASHHQLLLELITPEKKL